MRIAITDQAVLKDFQTRTGPWSAFFEVLTKRNHKVVSLNDSPDVVVFMNLHRFSYRSSLKGLPRDKRILVLWEPRTNRPLNFNKKSLEGFGLILAPSKLWISGENVIYFNWPQPAPQSYDNDWNKRKSKFVAVWGNKFSQDKESLYHLRRKVANEMAFTLDLYGTNWESPTKIIKEFVVSVVKSNGRVARGSFSDTCSALKIPQNYMGIIENKWQLYQAYKFGLVLENSKEYVSEKLFEALISGLIPVYVGPKLSDFGIPEDMSINVPPDVKAIAQACFELTRASNAQHMNLRRNAEKFLNSKRFLDFRNDQVLRKMAISICEYLDDSK